MPAPALSPYRPIRAGSTSRWAACSTSQVSPAKTSSAGVVCCPPGRAGTRPTARGHRSHRRRGRCRARRGRRSRRPTPPPWAWTTAAADARPAGANQWSSTGVPSGAVVDQVVRVTSGRGGTSAPSAACWVATASRIGRQSVGSGAVPSVSVGAIAAASSGSRVNDTAFLFRGATPSGVGRVLRVGGSGIADAPTIGQISARTGLTVRALRSRERDGLLAHCGLPGKTHRAGLRRHRAPRRSTTDAIGSERALGVRVIVRPVRTRTSSPVRGQIPSVVRLTAGDASRNRAAAPPRCPAGPGFRAPSTGPGPRCTRVNPLLTTLQWTA